MAKEKVCGVYCIENLINNKKYIGSSINIYRRWDEHKYSLKKNKHHSYKLQRAWNKYGEENFTFYILETYFGSNKELRNLEQIYLDLYKTYNFTYGYNVSLVSEGGSSYPATEEDIINGKFKISKKQFDEIIYYLCNTNLSIPNISKITNVNQRNIYQIYFKENYNTLVQHLDFIKRKTYGEYSCRSKLSENQVTNIIDRLLNEEFFIDISRDYNIPIETVRDIYNHKTWNYLTKNIIFPKYKKASGRTNKPINQYDLEGNFIATYESAREAERQTGIGYKMISRVCKGERPYTHGYTFKFAS